MSYEYKPVLAAVEQDPVQRSAFFAAALPGMAQDLEHAWQRAPDATLAHDRRESPFRAPRTPSRGRRAFAQELTALIANHGSYGPDTAWLLQWAPRKGLGRLDGTGIGRIASAAIDVGDDDLLALVLGILDGTDEVGIVSEPVIATLLMSSRPELWARAGHLLLSAQREEGLRQTILDLAASGHPDALTHLVGLVVEHDLHRFASVTRAIGGWLWMDVNATDRKASGALISDLSHVLSNSRHREEAIDSGDGLGVALGLWATATRDADAALLAAARVVPSADPERRAGAAWFLARHGGDGVVEPLVRLLDDPEPAIVAYALRAINSSYKRQLPDLADPLEQLYERLPERPIDHDTLGPLPAGQLERSQALYWLMHHRKDVSVDRLIPHAKAFGPWDRSTLAGRLGPDQRDTLLMYVSDQSEQVRAAAFKALGDLELTDLETRSLEPLLRRKPNDLRRGVLALIERQGQAWTLEAGVRLVASKNAQQRLGGIDLLGRLASGSGTAAAAAKQRLAQLSQDDADASVAHATKTASSAEPLAAATEADAFGLVPSADTLTPPREPKTRGTVLGSPGVLATYNALRSFFAENRGLPLTVTYGDGVRADEETTVLGHWLRLAQASSLTPSLEELFGPVLDAVAGGDDGQSVAALSILLEDSLPSVLEEPWNDPVTGERLAEPLAEGMSVWSDHDAGGVRIVLATLAHSRVSTATFDWLLDATEDLLARWDGAPVPEPPEPGRWSEESELWSARQRFRMAGLRTVRTLRAARPTLLSTAAHARIWGLERWACENVYRAEPSPRYPTYDPARKRATTRIPTRPDLESVVAAFGAGVATEADVIDHLVGPRSWRWEFDDLHRLTVRGGVSDLGGDQRLQAIIDRVRARILEVELLRGEEPTQASVAARALGASGGLEAVAPALAALRKDGFKRGASYGDEGRAAVFSHIIQVSTPLVSDAPEAFAAAMASERITDARLRELACYAPQWASHVEHTLGEPGFADAVWWIHAHTKDDRWSVSPQVVDTWRAEIALRSELTAAELTDGAVDVQWFSRVDAGLDPDAFAQLLKASKYASGASGHKRAVLFASALTGDVPLEELRKQVEEKRTQDAVRALGLVPLNAAAPTDDALDRYRLIQRFLRERKQFGAQKQASEQRAGEIALGNLARTAGYRDAVRLSWAMEAEATADLCDGASATVDDVTVTLRLDSSGRPELSVERGEKTLKAVPPAAKKDPTVKALTARRTELRQLRTRIRTSLEQAMIRGDRITGDELRQYREHLVLWPALRALVLVVDGTTGDHPALLGLPSEDGSSLIDASGEVHELAADDEMRVAHPTDLVAAGSWPAWQRMILEGQIEQPCKQVFREVYVPVDHEVTETGGSRRYAGHQLQPRQARALLLARGWTFAYAGEPVRYFRDEGIIVRLDFLAAWGSPADVEPPTLEDVRFSAVDGGAVVPSAVPPRLFSEVMRDLDLVVSVAHAGDVDPEATQSTVALRAALITETCALLSVQNVKVEAPRVLIDGALGRYSVHLGSAQVQQLPGGAVCIVPVSSQQRGRVFLPFADDDPRSAELVAKVLMLARDAEIRDPTISAQLRR